MALGLHAFYKGAAGRESAEPGVRVLGSGRAVGRDLRRTQRDLASSLNSPDVATSDLASPLKAAFQLSVPTAVGVKSDEVAEPCVEVERRSDLGAPGSSRSSA